MDSKASINSLSSTYYIPAKLAKESIIFMISVSRFRDWMIETRTATNAGCFVLKGVSDAEARELSLQRTIQCPKTRQQHRMARAKSWRRDEGQVWSPREKDLVWRSELVDLHHLRFGRGGWGTPDWKPSGIYIIVSFRLMFLIYYPSFQYFFDPWSLPFFASTFRFPFFNSKYLFITRLDVFSHHNYHLFPESFRRTTQ